MVEFSGNLNMIPSVVTVRAPAALPAAGAYAVSPEVQCAGFRALALYLSYDEDAGTAAGAVTYYVQVRYAGSTAWYDLPSYTQAAVAPGADTIEHEQRVRHVYTPVGTGLETWAPPVITLGAAVEAFRLQCAESGAAGFPGVFGAVAQMGL